MASQQFPMPTPTLKPVPLTAFRVMSFDIYGTLIDWEAGMMNHLKPLVTQIPLSSSYHDKYTVSKIDVPDSPERVSLIDDLFTIEGQLKSANPEMRYNELLTQVFLKLAQKLDIAPSKELDKSAQEYGAGVGTWPAYPDTVQACQILRKYYKLIPLSNVDRNSFIQGTLAGPLKGVDFFRIYTAEDIGSYKPDPRNFEYLIKHAIEDAGLESQEQILHTAQSLFHDHMPAKKAKLHSCWIQRRSADEDSRAAEWHRNDELGYAYRFPTLGALAEEVEKAFEKEGKKV